MKIMAKKVVFCIILIIINLLYVLFLLSESEIFTGRFDFRVLYIPGLLFGLIVFPVINLVLWKIRAQISWVDYTLIVMPLLLWLLIIPGGSFVNFLFINFPLIWMVSFLYLFRFSDIVKDKNIYVAVLFLWALITIISFGINYFIPILPE